MLCACGCGEEIEPQWWHKYRDVRYKPGHRQKQGTRLGYVNKTNRGRVPPNTYCACGCGSLIPERHSTGKPRYANCADGRFYIHGHNGKENTGEKASGWKGGRSVSSHGYILIKKPDHPRADGKGYVPEHVLAWEAAHGESLSADQVIHHINGVKDDNRPENLVALTVNAHALIHAHLPKRLAPKEVYAAAGRKGSATRWKDHVKKPRGKKPTAPLLSES